MLAKASHLTVPGRKDMDPFGREGPAGFLDLAGVAAEREHPVGVGKELPRRELGELLVRCHDPEEVLHGGPALPRPERGKILGSADRLPIDVGRQGADDGVDAAALESGVETFDKADVGVGHGGLRLVVTPGYASTAARGITLTKLLRRCSFGWPQCRIWLRNSLVRSCC